jgi:hypothetical protein
VSYYNTPEDMARTLVGYIPDDRRVQSEIAATLGAAPHLCTIRALRTSREYQEGMAKAWREQRPLKGLVDKDGLYRDKMAQASSKFADRLVAEGWHA